MSCVIKYKGLSIPEENFIEHLQKLISINDMFDNLEGFADGVYEDLGFESKQENASEIYNKLGGKTKEGNVIIKSVYQQAGVQYAKSIDGVFSLRVNGTNNHFGNPFSSVESEIQKGLIRTKSTKESVEKYIEWVLSPTTTIKPEQHKFIRESLRSGKLKGKPIVYYKELGEPSHATALDYLINKYNWNNQITLERKQKAIQIYSRYITEDVEGVGLKNWIKGIKTLDYQSELLNLDNSDEILYQKQIDLQVEQDDVLKEFASSLSERFNISFDLVSEEEAKSNFPEYTNEPAFFDPKTKKAYLVKGKADKTSAIHEIFTHPFLLQIEKTNPTLYKNLLKEAKNNKSVVDYVDNLYGTNQNNDHEYIARAIDLAVQGELDRQKDKTLLERIQEFFNQLSNYLKRLFNIPEVFSSAISPNITLQQLAQFAMYGKGKMNLNPAQKNIEYSLKATNVIVKNLDKIKQWEKNKSISEDVLWKKIQELGVPKEQIELVKNSEGNTVEEKLLDFVNQYSYTVEINTAVENKSQYAGENNFYIPEGEFYGDYTVVFKDLFSSEIEDYRRNGESISKEEYLKAQEYSKNLPLTNTQHYSHLTVPGGTNYTENEIATPAITPSIEGHAQFSTDNGIGWFRSDDKTITEKSVNKAAMNAFGLEDENESSILKQAGVSKTRRILEVQSDLFQKGRNIKVLSKKLEIKKVGDTFTSNGEQFTVTNIDTDSNLYELITIQDSQGRTATMRRSQLEKRFDERGDNSSENQFLQLLNKDNNWVTFFVKSIIQDSAKKGYEKVLFPKGDTAAKIEGHQTLEEFKKQKEKDIKKLEDGNKIMVEEIEEIQNSTIEDYVKKNPRLGTYEVLKFKRFRQRGEPLGDYVKVGIKTKEEAIKIFNKNLKESIEIYQSYLEANNRNIKTYKQELADVESGKTQLSSIAKFYEQTITNILKKQGYNPVEITDEYGNTWNEVTIDENRDNQNIVFQKAPQSNAFQQFQQSLNNPNTNPILKGNRQEIKNPVYSAVFFDTNKLISKYKQVHPNLYSHHSTIEFKPSDISDLPIGENLNIKIVGRLTTDKVDVLIVDNPLSKNKFPHITLSTAEGVKPFESNSEIEKNQDKIVPIQDSIEGTVGVFDGKNEIIIDPQQEQLKKFDELQERLNNKEFLEAAKYAFESSEELQQFGTQEQYNDYIARVSLGIIKNPSSGEYNYESKVRDIVYHGTQSKDKFDKFERRSELYGFYFTNYEDYSKQYGNNITSIINLVNPKIYDSVDKKEYSKIANLASKDEFNEYDGIIIKNFLGSNEIVAFEPEQIHILSSKADIQGFKEFVNNVKNNSEDVSEYDKYFGDVISDENVTDQNDNNLQDTFLQKENESKLPSNKELNKMMQIFLEKIGVRINAVDHIKDASGKKLNAIAKADIMSKIIDVVQGKADITTLPEEAGHFFVELLPSNSPLLHEMMNKITSYKIYGQVYEQYKKIYTLPDGSPDFVKIKKEAIGKLIAQHIIKDFKGSESDSKLTSIKNWFRKVIDYILSILHKAGFVVENPFEQVAKQILAADTTGLNQEASVRSELYQLDPDGNIDAEVEDVIDVSSAENKLMEDQSKIVLDNSIDPVTKQKRHVYTYEGKKVKSSVTQKYVDPWIRKIYNTDTRSEIQKIIDLEKAHYGDLSHEEMQGIVSSWTNPDGTLKSEQGPHQIVTNKTVYDKLNNLFQQIASQYPEGTKFKAEVKIYDKMADVAGSIDLLVIQPNGVVDIYDWKTQEIHKDQTELKWYKEKMYQIQLENYRKILEMEYGFVKFGKIRAIPIATKFQYSKKGIIKLLDIEVGDVVDPRNIPDEKSYLLPVTLMGESTGNDMLDEFIGRLEGIYKKIGAVRYKNEEYYKRIEELAKIKTSIRDIRLRGDINKFIDLGIIEYNKFKKKLDNGELTGRDLLEAQRIMKVFEDSGKCLGELLKEYKKAAEESKDPDALKNYEKTRNRLFNMSQSASALLVEMVKYNNKQSEQLGQKEGIFNLLKPEAPIGALNGLMTALSGITHKSFRLFSNLLRFEQNKRDSEFKNYVEESEKMKKKFLDYCKKKGITPIKAMNMLLDIDENGNWSGNFIRKYKKEFSKEREQALRKGDIKWFIDNVVYDEELHQKYLEAEKKITELYNSIVYSLDEETQKKEVEKRIKLWKETYQVIKDDETLNYQALMNPSNRFVRPVDKWLTEEWNEIHNNKENAPLKEMYELFQKLIRKAEELGMLDGYNPRFIPSIYASKLDHLVFGDISKLFSSEGFFENLQVDAGNQYTPEIDPVDGTIINRIPVYFTNDIGVKREDGTMDYSKKSRDLFKVFTVFAAHVYNYEAMSNLEDSALMLLEAERNKKSLVTDNFGNLVFENGMVKVIDSNDKNAKMLEDFVNFYLYDRISGAGADAKFKLFGKEYSVLKSVRQAMSFFSLKTLGLNPISGTAQFVGGTGNALFSAHKGIIFTKTQWARGVYRCVSSKKAKAAIKYFDARLEGIKNYDINDASLSKVNSIFNADTAFFIQRKSDAAVQDPILLALMENHMLTDDGRIVKIDTYVKEKYDYNNSFYNKSDSERKEIRKKIEAEVKELQETKSLFAIGKIDDEGKFYIPGLDKKSKEFSKFKDKVKAVSKSIIGNSSHDDINRIRTTVLGMALMQFRNWIPAMVAERTGKFKYNDALETYTIGKFNLFLSEMFSSRFPSLIKSLLLGFGTDGIAAAKAKYQEMKREAYEKGEEWTITEGEFIDLYIGSLRSQMLELIVILSFVGLMFALFSSGDDDDKPRDGFLMYLSRAMDKYKQEFLFYYDPREFTNLVRTPIPVVGLLEDFYRFVGAFAEQSAGFVTSDEEMMDKAKPGKYFLRMVPGFNPALVLMAAYDDEFRKEWGIKVTIN